MNLQVPGLQSAESKQSAASSQWMDGSYNPNEHVAKKNLEAALAHGVLPLSPDEDGTRRAAPGRRRGEGADRTGEAEGRRGLAEIDMKMTDAVEMPKDVYQGKGAPKVKERQGRRRESNPQQGESKTLSRTRRYRLTP
jgi:hypothetical protein